jgi:hypothetical protein
MVQKSGDIMTGALILAKNTDARIILQQKASGYSQEITFTDKADTHILGIGKNSYDEIILGEGAATDDHTKEVRIAKDGSYITIRGNAEKLISAISGGYKVQSGSIAATVAGSFSVTFPTAFATTPVVRATYFTNGNAAAVGVSVTAKSTTRATFYIGSGYTGGTIEWEAIGT